MICRTRHQTVRLRPLLVWGGFVTSRRGSKGGFHLAAEADQITMGEVIDFFLSRHPPEPEVDLAVMRVFEKSSAPCRRAFSRLTLAHMVSRRSSRSVSTPPERKCDVAKSLRF